MELAKIKINNIWDTETWKAGLEKKKLTKYENEKEWNCYRENKT